MTGGQRSRNSQTGLRGKLRRWQTLVRSSQAPPLPDPPASNPSLPSQPGTHCASRSLPSGYSGLPLWPLGLMYQVQGHQGEGGAGQGSGSRAITEPEKKRRGHREGPGRPELRRHSLMRKLPSSAWTRRACREGLSLGGSSMPSHLLPELEDS